MADAEAYLSSNPKVMWVLNDPYDEFENGQPKGGGAITDDCIAKIDEKSVAPTWHNMIYMMCGIRHGKKWEEIPYIRDDKSIANILKEIAYINVSKMPNRSTTSDSELRHLYDIWKEILWKQINLYDPDIIIFGATFQLFQNDFDQKDDLKKVNDLGVWAWKNKLLLSAYHPQRKGEEYVDNLISIINMYYKQ